MTGVRPPARHEQCGKARGLSGIVNKNCCLLEHPLENLVMGFEHSHAAIGLAGADVIASLCDVTEAKRLAGNRLLLMNKQRLENAATAEIRPHINALQPPDVAVAPIAPFVRDEELADDFVVAHGDKVSSLGFIA